MSCLRRSPPLFAAPLFSRIRASDRSRVEKSVGGVGARVKTRVENPTGGRVPSRLAVRSASSPGPTRSVARPAMRRHPGSHSYIEATNLRRLTLWGADPEQWMRETRSMATPADLSHRKRTRIVIADEDRLYAEMVQAAFAEHAEAEVVGIAADGTEALELVEQQNASLVLMDVNMPRLGGIQATRRLRELDNPPTVVLVTGTSATGDDFEALDIGASAYLRKTGDAASLIEVVAALCQLNAAQI